MVANLGSTQIVQPQGSGWLNDSVSILWNVIQLFLNCIFYSLTISHMHIISFVPSYPLLLCPSFSFCWNLSSSQEIPLLRSWVLFCFLNVSGSLSLGLPCMRMGRRFFSLEHQQFSSKPLKEVTPLPPATINCQWTLREGWGLMSLSLCEDEMLAD